MGRIALSTCREPLSPPWHEPLQGAPISSPCTTHCSVGWVSATPRTCRSLLVACHRLHLRIKVGGAGQTLQPSFHLLAEVRAAERQRKASSHNMATSSASTSSISVSELSTSCMSSSPSLSTSCSSTGTPELGPCSSNSICSSSSSSAASSAPASSASSRCTMARRLLLRLLRASSASNWSIRKGTKRCPSSGSMSSGSSSAPMVWRWPLPKTSKQTSSPRSIGSPNGSSATIEPSSASMSIGGWQGPDSGVVWTEGTTEEGARVDSPSSDGGSASSH
mmetsp:Transcript_71975/g.166644  ORF Transcript_71975/g.166644 Transcript_71975/m.166644 type:complete len:278 (-) Transcript_71975:1186-2019(-)